MKVLLPKDGSKQEAIVKQRQQLADGTLKDSASDHVMLDTLVYEVGFGD